MTGRIEKTVFISYRRTNFWTALAVYQHLHSNGYDVFFDYKSIPSGDFEQVIIENVRSRAHFVVILSPSALDRCKEPGDWLRREIETAIDSKRNIIPLVMEGFDFGTSAIVEALTGKLADLKKYNTLSIPAEYFEEAMAKLRSDRFLKRPLESVSHPVSEITEQITEEQKSAANEAAPVEEGQLTAQTWFERGYVFAVQTKNFEEAIRCFSEAIRLEPSFAEAYNNLGNSLAAVGRFEEAAGIYRKAITLDPSNATAYFNLGNLHRQMKNYDKARDAFHKARELDPSDPSLSSLANESWERQDRTTGAMNANILEGRWMQLKGSIREKWGELTDDELDQIAGKRDRLAGILQERYGYSELEAERELDEFLGYWDT
jgi:tetratricopeptide (TPR) repeat protein